MRFFNHLSRHAAPPLFFALLVSLCCGCLGSPPTFYHVIRGRTPEGSWEGLSERTETIQVQETSIPHYLERQSLLTRTAPYSYTVSETEKWADSLDELFTAAIIEHPLWREHSIEALKYGGRSSRREGTLSLLLTVSRFEIDSEDRGLFQGRWKVSPVKGKDVELLFHEELRCLNIKVEKGANSNVSCLNRMFDISVEKLFAYLVEKKLLKVN